MKIDTKLLSLSCSMPRYLRRKPLEMALQLMKDVGIPNAEEHIK